MSTPAFIAAGIACGGAVTILFLALRLLLLGLLDIWQRHRLEHRVELRLARGNDRSFEERRPVETPLARPDPPPAQTSMAARVIQFAAIPLLGMMLFSLFLSPNARPEWVRLLPNFMFILMGAQWAFAPVDVGIQSVRALRAAGVGMILLFSAFTIFDLYNLT